MWKPGIEMKRIERDGIKQKEGKLSSELQKKKKTVKGKKIESKKRIMNKQ